MIFALASAAILTCWPESAPGRDRALNGGVLTVPFSTTPMNILHSLHLSPDGAGRVSAMGSRRYQRRRGACPKFYVARFGRCP